MPQENKELPLSTNSSDLWRSFVLGSTEQSSPSQILNLKKASSSFNFDEIDEAQYSEGAHGQHHHQVKPKRIIICCDGTWQSSATSRENIPSNVSRLARSIALTDKSEDDEQPEIQQVVYYSGGVGTGGGLSMLEKVRQAISGDGLDSEVIQAYNFIVSNYAPHDQIFCFGFSRGAYTARSVAGLVNDIGIIQPKEMNEFPGLYSLYKNCKDSFRFRQSQAYRKWVTGIREKGYETLRDHEDVHDHWEQVPHHVPPEFTRVVEVVGVFDTVGALGIPGLDLIPAAPYLPGIDQVGFHNPTLSKYIRHAYHALALDEHKRPFTPTLWRLPSGEQQVCHCIDSKDSETPAAKFRRLLRVEVMATEEQLDNAWKQMIEQEMYKQVGNYKMDLKQVWFPGGHINIGGGNTGILYGFPFDFEQLALLSFTWMCDQIKEHLRLDDQNLRLAASQLISVDHDDSGLLKELTTSTLADREIMSRKKLINAAMHNTNYGLNIPQQLIQAGLNFTGLWNDAFRTVITGVDDAWATGPIIDALSPFLRVIPFASLTRTPGEYRRDFAGNDDGQTNEQIHPSVYYRCIKTGNKYKPKSLKGFNRVKKMKWESDGEFQHVYEYRKGNLVLPEYIIKRDDHISRRLAECSRGGREFVAKLTGEASSIYIHA
ncbi:hypothetical protein CCHL11_04531 [Colletotrichum chlorophyti]|uniref:T6SS Phospholipase effector Tle1-like catalytic domain-containing protein n=1 Tax=Colletotrichum chlorophyti TaxID=708187 RepID=A0A1Q8RRU3_9PEZI|nr:hypothetical protein CCHL11_04531 [Colletotrichum chlorophyti]